MSNIADHVHCGSIRTKPVCDNNLGVPKTLHRPLEENQGGLAIPAFRDKYLQNFALAIDSAPRVLSFAIDPHEDLIQVPSPVRKGMISDPTFPYLGREHWIKAVPPIANGFVGNVDTAFVQQIFDISK